MRPEPAGRNSRGGEILAAWLRCRVTGRNEDNIDSGRLDHDPKRTVRRWSGEAGELDELRPEGAILAGLFRTPSARSDTMGFATGCELAS